jgi:Ser-tRNA(Ala) deacylase AlaX
MTTRALFRDDAYLTHCEATITAIDEQGVHLDQTVFYPLGGGQAGDAGSRLRIPARPNSKARPPTMRCTCL